jgi:hypothetical protein
MVQKTSKFPKVLLIMVFLFSGCLILPQCLLAFEKVITIPAENPNGIVLDLEKGSYIVKYEAGAVALFYPINPHYSWIISTAIGRNSSGGQDSPDIGTIYFQPRPAAFSQYEAEQLALEAVKGGHMGLQFDFVLDEDSEVRFWISDFDYTDNSGMIKLQVKSLA